MTDAEQAFLTMAKMAGYHWEKTSDEYGVYWLFTADFDDALEGKIVGSGPNEAVALIESGYLTVETFHIVASTFEAVVIERPELREAFDWWTKEAEDSQ